MTACNLLNTSEQSTALSQGHALLTGAHHRQEEPQIKNQAPLHTFKEQQIHLPSSTYFYCTVTSDMFRATRVTIFSVVRTRIQI